jgi:predicted dithiol-disulfide oxidoreductase (DUF899 family)
MTDQEKTPNLKVPRMRSVHPVAAFFERRARGLKRLRRPAKVARDERDLGLSDNASRARHRLLWAERVGGTSQESLGPREIPELRHRDASKRESGRVIAQSDPLQRPEGITLRERSRRCRDQRVHRNPATLVTPIASLSSSNFISCSTNTELYPETLTRRRAMTKQTTGTREEWLAARLELLKAEKELTRRSDELARQRQAMPAVRIDKQYLFETDEGTASLADLFRGRSQLLIYHFMFGTDYKAGCPSCSMIADGFNGFAVHLANHDVMLWAVSRAPLAKLQAYKQRMGWTFPWASSHASDFNSDFNVWFTEEQQCTGGVEYNYRREPVFLWRSGQEGGGQGAEDQFAATCGVDAPTYHRDRPGMSAFVIQDGVVHHTYSTYARGLDVLWGAYQWLDRAPKGRNEAGIWWRRHDEYDQQ